MNFYRLSAPVVIESANAKRKHWSAEHRTKKNQQHTVAWVCRQHRIKDMVDKQGMVEKVILTRHYVGRRFDDDNCIAGFKRVRDAVAFELGLGMALGHGDEKIAWEYEQEKSQPTSGMGGNWISITLVWR